MTDKLKIVCLGDSITWGYPHGTEYSWVSMLADLMDAHLINEGISGDTTAQMLLRFDSSVLHYHPTHVVVMGGINDVFWRFSFDQIVNNLISIVKQAEQNEIKVIFGLPTAVDFPEYERMLWRIRDWMKAYAAKNGIQVIDFCSAFYDEAGEIRSDLLLPDGGHPTIDGYRVMFKKIDPSIFE